MIYQPPAGARDLLPLDVIQKHWIETHLQESFQRWGYHWIETSTLERLETLVAGGAVQRDRVIQIYDSEHDDLGLRPELTASIARTAVTRMAAVAHPQRLCYSANVFRKSPKGSASHQHEFFQAGVELLGAGAVTADAEILLLLTDCLDRLGLTGWQLLIGEAELTRSLLAPFPKELCDRVQRAIAKLDRVALEQMGLSADLEARAIAILELRGEPVAVLERLAQFSLEPSQRAMLNRLKALLDLVTAASGGRSLPIILDLSLVQTFDYYTGLVIEAIGSAETGHEVLAQGGRYDRLLGVYHPEGTTYPGVGFCLNLEPLRRSLKTCDRLPRQLPTSDWLVVPLTVAARAAAFVIARQLRDQGHTFSPAATAKPSAHQPSDERGLAQPSQRSLGFLRVELDLKEAIDQETIRDRARQRRIPRIAWVDETGHFETEVLA